MLDVHWMRVDLPTVEVGHDTSCARTWRPDGELNAVFTVAGAMVCAHSKVVHVFLVCYSGKSIVHGTRPLAQVCDIAVVFDHVVGPRTRFLWIDLGRDTRAHVFGIGAVALHNARDALFVGCDDNDRLINHVDVTRLEEQRHDVHDELIGLRVRFALLRQPTTNGCTIH